MTTSGCLDENQKKADTYENPAKFKDFYYGEAEKYVSDNYNLPREKGIKGLYKFLNNTKLPRYREGVFDCSESTALLEWLLEGAGFNASIAFNYKPNQTVSRPHSWVVVTLIEGKTNVAVESTHLTEDSYDPPGIIATSTHGFRRYTSINETAEIPLECRKNYYNPKATFCSLTTLRKGYEINGTIRYYEKKEIDWWNVKPYSKIQPFELWK